MVGEGRGAGTMRKKIRWEEGGGGKRDVRRKKQVGKKLGRRVEGGGGKGDVTNGVVWAEGRTGDKEARMFTF
eukprot:26756-Chlamydomonas_euryale.AAC.1